MVPARLFLISWAVAATGWSADSSTVNGPVAGFIFEATPGAIRPLRGVAAAARLGAPIIADVEYGSVSPDGSAALAVETSGALRLYTGLRTGALTPIRVGNTVIHADRVAWAPDGGSAIVYATRGGPAQVLGGLTATPRVNSSIDLSSLPSAAGTMLFDGQYVVAAPLTGGIYLAAKDGSIRQIAASAAPTSLALAGSTLYFTDSKSHGIWRISDYAAAAAVHVFAEDRSISSIAGLAASADGRRLYVADAGGHSLVIYDTSSQAVIERLTLEFIPTRLERFGNPTAFLMNGSGDGPLYVFAENPSGKPAVYFIPPADSHPRQLHLRPI